jgi:hypothetical protein
MPMTQAEMLHPMCQEILSKADIKAISQARGFSAAEAASPTVFESFFLTDIGVGAAMKTLSSAEVVPLHFLHAQAAPVNLAFFSRVSPFT